MIFFDPLDMSKIYEVIDVGEGSRSDAYLDGERARIAAGNGVAIERVKAQRGVKERTADTGYSVRVWVESQKREYEVMLAKELWEKKKVGDELLFTKPPSEQQ